MTSIRSQAGQKTGLYHHAKYSVATAALVLAALVFAQDVAHAQRRGRLAAVPRAGGIVVAAYYRPLYIAPFYDPFYDPWWYPYPRGWYAPYGPGYYYDDTASLRLQVTPRDTEVYVDGYYAGVVDDFDGMFQRLHLEPGSHDVTLYLPGHRTSTQKIFLQDRGTFRIRHTMVPRAPGEPAEARPAATASTPGVRRVRAERQPPRREDVVRADRSFGAIAIRVQPGDAEVLIDGERWEGPRDDEALVVQVAPGAHRIEVRKDGYRPYNADVVVTAAQTSPLNVVLPRD